MSVKMSVEFTGMNEIMKKLNTLNADIKSITEDALTKTFEIVTAKADAAMVPANMPTGQYWTGDTKSSLVRSPKIYWNGTEASVYVGFDSKKGGFPSIFLLRGTPYHKPVQVLVDAFYGDQTRGEVMLAQKEIFTSALEKLQ